RKRRLTIVPPHLYPTKGVLTPDGKTLILGHASLKFYDLATGKETADVKCPGGTSYLTVSGNGKLLASSHGRGKICVWDLKTRKRLFTWVPKGPFLGLNYHRGAWRIALSTDGKYLAAADCYRYNVYDVTKRDLYRTIDLRHFNGGLGDTLITFTPDGKKLVMAGSGHVTATYLSQFPPNILTRP